MDGFKIGKGVRYVKAVYCHSAYLNYMHSTSKQNARVDGAQARINVARRIINNLRYSNDSNLMTESKEEILDKGERGE